MSNRPNLVDPKVQKINAALEGSDPSWPKGVRRVGWENIGKLGVTIRAASTGTASLSRLVGV